MVRHIRGCWLGFGVLLAMAGGCIESQPLENSTPFEVEELDSVLAIVIDLSGSFAHSWDDRAFDLFGSLMDRFFTEGMGGETRIVLAQLSGNDNVILFEGRPSEFRTRFRSPEVLSEFLRDHSDPNRSPVFEATGKAVDYVASMPAITDNTRVLTVILSDMADSENVRERRSREGYTMLDALKRYQQKGGALALYFVAKDETVRWRRIIEMAGFTAGSYVIENELVANPQLPRFN